MISFLADLVLAAALVAAATQMRGVRRELRRLRVDQDDYKRAIASSAAALADAQGSVERLSRNGLAVAARLGAQIDWAGALLDRFDTLAAIAARRATAGAMTPTKTPDDNQNKDA